ncbi:MAG TPA: 3-hydroxyacyl-CoA dehydrogenase NAD-binding domain-containing protein [Nitrososphaerales archaeon]|nr:3-hydroxyacyl-CoA dehydrogenase NAD-binding domain-containing protein [Nitrososphaerales archaeon]
MGVRKVTVVGAGDMGHGIAELFAVSGYDVSLTDKLPEMLNKAKGRIAASLDKLVEKGRLTLEDSQSALSRLGYFGDLKSAVSQADLVIEAVPESLELKRSVFKAVSDLAPSGAIMASNTSNIKISDLAVATDRPQRMVGMHFFNPPMVMKLVEVIPGIQTDAAVVDEVVEVCSKLGRTAVKVQKDSPGFIVNRINAADTLFFCLILDKGIATPPEVDIYAKSQGLPMGPYELLDFVGVDIGADSLAYFAKVVSPEYGKGVTFAKMVAAGLLGKKTGKGFYDWSSGKAQIPDASPTDKVSLMDIFALEINEAVKLIEEGVAGPDDIEKGVTLGMNRPFGPIAVAKDLSNAEVKAKLEELAARFDCGVFAPARSIAEGRMRDAVEGRLSRPAQTVVARVEGEGVNRAQGPTNRTESVRLEKLSGGVAKVTLNRPRLNMINSDVLEKLDGIVTELWDDTGVRVVVVTGDGPIFSAGADLSQFFRDSDAFMEFARKGAKILKRLSEMPKLTIAVLKGYALGGGLELAISCDIRIATEDVEIGFPELTRGLVPAWSGTQRLPKLLGLARASSLLLTSERIKGKRAFEIGLVNYLVSSGDPDEYAVKYATQLASAQAPVAVMLAKRLLDKGVESPTEVGLEMEAKAAGVLFGTEDLKEGVSAFLGKRKAEFKGK